VGIIYAFGKLLGVALVRYFVIYAVAAFIVIPFILHTIGKQ